MDAKAKVPEISYEDTNMNRFSSQPANSRRQLAAAAAAKPRRMASRSRQLSSRRMK
jgi:hypothetical protein